MIIKVEHVIKQLFSRRDRYIQSATNQETWDTENRNKRVAYLQKRQADYDNAIREWIAFDDYSDTDKTYRLTANVKAAADSLASAERDLERVSANGEAKGYRRLAEEAQEAINFLRDSGVDKISTGELERLGYLKFIKL